MRIDTKLYEKIPRNVRQFESIEYYRRYWKGSLYQNIVIFTVKPKIDAPVFSILFSLSQKSWKGFFFLFSCLLRSRRIGKIHVYSRTQTWPRLSEKLKKLKKAIGSSFLWCLCWISRGHRTKCMCFEVLFFLFVFIQRFSVKSSTRHLHMNTEYFFIVK